MSVLISDEFHSRTVCEDDVIELSCNPNSRLVIYDAQYGRIAHEPSHTCPQPPGVMDDGEISVALQVVGRSDQR